MSFNKVSKQVLLNKFGIFLWIIICNIFVQSFLPQLEGIGFRNWIFFLTNILFFMLSDKSYKKRFLTVLWGSIVGLVSAYLFCIVYPILLKMGDGYASGSYGSRYYCRLSHNHA